MKKILISALVTIGMSASVNALAWNNAPYGNSYAPPSAQWGAPPQAHTPPRQAYRQRPPPQQRAVPPRTQRAAPVPQTRSENRQRPPHRGDTQHRRPSHPSYQVPHAAPPYAWHNRTAPRHLNRPYYQNPAYSSRHPYAAAPFNAPGYRMMP
jgi:hypothetical protein